MEEKCPVCGESISFWTDSEVCHDGEIECSMCGFGCCKKDLAHITAAMDLARLTVQMKTCRAYCPERAFLYAQDRVLEVFGDQP